MLLLIQLSTTKLSINSSITIEHACQRPPWQRALRTKLLAKRTAEVKADHLPQTLLDRHLISDSGERSNDRIAPAYDLS